MTVEVIYRNSDEYAEHACEMEFDLVAAAMPAHCIVQWLKCKCIEGEISDKTANELAKKMFSMGEYEIINLWTQFNKESFGTGNMFKMHKLISMLVVNTANGVILAPVSYDKELSPVPFKENFQSILPRVLWEENRSRDENYSRRQVQLYKHLKREGIDNEWAEDFCYFALKNSVLCKKNSDATLKAMSKFYFQKHLMVFEQNHPGFALELLDANITFLKQHDEHEKLSPKNLRRIEKIIFSLNRFGCLSPKN